MKIIKQTDINIHTIKFNHYAVMRIKNGKKKWSHVIET